MNHTIQLHIFLSTLSFSVFCAAAFLAVLLAGQEYLLRTKSTVGVMTFLPALDRMENLLFKIIALGFVLLTAVVATGFWFSYAMLTSILWHKIFLSLFAWLIFLILLMGRHRYGWRGRPAIRWTLGGVLLVMLAYFSSELL